MRKGKEDKREAGEEERRGEGAPREKSGGRAYGNAPEGSAMCHEKERGWS